MRVACKIFALGLLGLALAVPAAAQTDSFNTNTGPRQRITGPTDCVPRPGMSCPTGTQGFGGGNPRCLPNLRGPFISKNWSCGGGSKGWPDDPGVPAAISAIYALQDCSKGLGNAYGGISITEVKASACAEGKQTVEGVPLGLRETIASCWGSLDSAAGELVAARRLLDHGPMKKVNELRHHAKDTLEKVGPCIAGAIRELAGYVEAGNAPRPKGYSGGGPRADRSGADPENDYIRGFLEGVATCVQGIFVGPVQTVQQIGTHAGYYWEIGAALWRGDRETAARILEIKTAEDIHNFAAVYNPDVGNARPREAGYRQGSRLCQFGLIPGINKARAGGPTRPAPPRGGETPRLPGASGPQAQPQFPSPVGPLEKPSLPLAPITALPHLPSDSHRPSPEEAPIARLDEGVGPGGGSKRASVPKPKVGIPEGTVKKGDLVLGLFGERVEGPGLQSWARERGAIIVEDEGLVPQRYDPSDSVVRRYSTPYVLALEEAARRNKQIHFDLSGLDVERALKEQRALKEPCHTCGELRWIRDNWKNWEKNFGNAPKPKFYRDGVELGRPPWLG